jgi:uncharacterized GH25 family protein
MKLMCLIVTALFIVLVSGLAFGHSVWVAETKSPGGELSAFILGNARYFPQYEELSAETVESSFDPIVVMGEEGEVKLKPGSVPNAVVSEDALSPGFYVVSSRYKPNYLSITPEGERIWKSKKEVPLATKCDTLVRFAKGIVAKGNPREDSFALKPIGQELEIIPLSPIWDPNSKSFSFEVLFEGKSLPNARFELFKEGFGDEKSAFFQGETDKDGRLIVEAPSDAAGFYLAKVYYSRPFTDLSLCDLERFEASLSYVVK